MKIYFKRMVLFLLLECIAAIFDILLTRSYPLIGDFAKGFMTIFYVGILSSIVWIITYLFTKNNYDIKSRNRWDLAAAGVSLFMYCQDFYFPAASPKHEGLLFAILFFPLLIYFAYLGIWLIGEIPKCTIKVMDKIGLLDWLYKIGGAKKTHSAQELKGMLTTLNGGKKYPKKHGKQSTKT